MVALADENGLNAEDIITAFLLGVAEGAAQAFPSPEQAGRSIGRRVTLGRGKNARLFPAQVLEDNISNPPKKRKRSAYNKELSRQLKLLRAKHPRTPVTKLMAKAHRATRKKMKK